MRRNETTRTVRVPEGGKQMAAPQLQASRRPMAAGGNDKAIRNADALIRAIDYGTGLYQNMLEERQAKFEKEVGRQVFNITKAEALGTEYTPADAEQDAYNRARIIVGRERTKREFRKEALTLYPEARQQEDFDLDIMVDELAAKYWNGIDTSIDAEYEEGQEVLQEIIAVREELRALEGANIHAEDRQETADGVMYNALEAAKEGPVTGDHWREWDELLHAVGQRDAKYTNGVLMEIAKAYADSGDIEALEAMPEFWEGGAATIRSAAGYGDTYRALMAQAQDVNQKANLAATQSERALYHTQLKQFAARRDPEVLNHIEAAGRPGPNGEPPKLTQAQQTSLYDTYYSATSEAALNDASAGLILTGNGISLTQSDFDAGINAAAEALKKANPDAPQEEINAVLFAKMVENNNISSGLKDVLMVNWKNPEKFKQGFHMAMQFEAQHPGFLATQIGDDQALVFDTYERYVADLGDEDKALEALSQHDPELYKQVPKKLIDTAVEEAGKEIMNKPGLRMGSYELSGQMARRIRKSVEHYINAGNTAEQAQRYTEKLIMERTVLVGGRRYEKNVGWGQSPQVVYDWAVMDYAAEHGIDEDDVEIVPHTNDPRMVLVRDKGSNLPGTGLPVPIRELAKGHSDAQKQLLDAGIDTGIRKARERAAQQAKDQAFPVSPYGKAGDRAYQRKRQQERWDALSPEQRERLINNQINGG